MSRAREALALLLAAWSLGACGFAPLYGDDETAEETWAALSAIEIAAPKGGQNDFLESLLARRFHRRGRIEGSHILNLDVSVAEEGLFVRQDALVTRHNVIYTVRYSLSERGSEKPPLFRDVARATVAYNRRVSQFQTFTARRAARERAARQAAEVIRRRVVLLLRSSLGGGEEGNAP